MNDLNAQTSDKLVKIIEVVRQDLGSIRTGKASVHLVENIQVEAYGTSMRVLDLAVISVFDPTTLLLTPFDISNTGAITKAIGEANLGLTAIVEETRVRVVVPAVSEERRQEYVKLAKTKVEGGRVMIRQARHEIMEEIAKGNFDEDARKRLEKEVQGLVDKFNGELDALLAEKEKELMSI